MVLMWENIWKYFLDAWLNNISFLSHREVIRCSFSIWQNDEFPHRILHWSVNVFNKLHSITETLRGRDCGWVVVWWHLSYFFQSLLISVTNKPKARHFKNVQFFNMQTEFHEINHTCIHSLNMCRHNNMLTYGILKEFRGEILWFYIKFSVL